MDNGIVRFGILGCASIARKLSRAILMTPGVCLHALGSRSLEKAQAFAAANSFPSETKIYGSYQDVLNDEAVDAVYMPLPTSLHLYWVLKASEKKKHVLLEKPPALSVEDLDTMISACEKHGVQLMDGTMWVHHPRTAKMKEILHNEELLGDVLEIQCNFCVLFPEAALKENIRMRSDLDALGALGDLGWYCARGALWAADYKLPKSVTALPEAKFNNEGVILGCGASFLWKDGRIATIHCSFVSNMRMSLIVNGRTGTLECEDFVIPFKEDVAHFKLVTGSQFGNMDLHWSSNLNAYEVHSNLPQECLMVQKFASIVKDVRDSAGLLDSSWPMMTRKTQLLLNAIKTSIENGYSSVILN